MENFNEYLSELRQEKSELSRRHSAKRKQRKQKYDPRPKFRYGKKDRRDSRIRRIR